jgi:hypothetical protein
LFSTDNIKPQVFRGTFLIILFKLKAKLPSKKLLSTTSTLAVAKYGLWLLYSNHNPYLATAKVEVVDSSFLLGNFALSLNKMIKKVPRKT